ncbi:hypothetical protein MWU78_21385 [Arenibacter sp. F26102]|uniref:hypothetical protein n=1 Tax=Arenibacter sp. F26102 TaxID=2926416 RepID=UPI001FF5F134|nr:hypothetical protein [Arenibacter sp. F26102]MCK0148214.1 hypothetical protein [Arenibacter sp. F26102]
MIDHIKILIFDRSEIDRIYNSSKLTFHNYNEKLSHFDFETILTKKTKSYNGILFCRFENKLDILFRPHYLFNNNIHNANDFSVGNCIEIINDFINDFEIVDFSHFKIVNIEFGLNFHFPGYGKDLVTYAEYHKKDQFRTDSELPYSKKSYSIDHRGRANTYKIIKMYCKGLQFPKYTDVDTLRIEVKSKKSAYIKQLGIIDIGDLTNPIVYKNLESELLQVVGELLILDRRIDFDKLNKRGENKLKEYLNTHTWFEALQKGRNEFSRKRKRYFESLVKAGRNVHQELYLIIVKKLESIQYKEVQKGANFPLKCQNEKGADFPAKLEAQKGADFPINIMEICTHLPNEVIELSKEQKDVLKRYGYGVLNYDREEREKMTENERALINSLNKKLAWVSRGEMALTDGNPYRFTKKHRKGFATAKLKRSNNHAMIYLVDCGVPTGRQHAAINKKVAKAINVDYGNRIAFWMQLASIVEIAKEKYNVVVDPSTFLDMINRTRGKKGLPQFLTSKSKSYEKVK